MFEIEEVGEKVVCLSGIEGRRGIDEFCMFFLKRPITNNYIT